MTHRAAAVPRLPPPPLPQLLLVLLLLLQLGVTHADPDPGNEPGTRPPDTLEAMERYNAAAVLFNEANVVWGNGDLEGAARMYRESIVLYPDLGEAHLNLGNILDGRPSLYHYQRAAECSHPDRGGNRVLYANALANVGLAMQRLAVRGRERSAESRDRERERERERVLGPCSCVCCSVLSLSTVYATVLDLSPSCLLSLISPLLSPRSPLFFLVSLVSLISLPSPLSPPPSTPFHSLRQGSDYGELGKAIAKLDEALSLEPTHLEALYNKGICMERQRRPQEALPVYLEVKRMHPSHVGVLLNIGNLLHR